MRVMGLPLHLWSREVFKLIGDGYGGLIAVDENTDFMAELQWARLLVKLVGRDLPTSVQLVVGSGCFSVQLWWETPPWFSQVVPVGSVYGKGDTEDEEEVGSGSWCAEEVCWKRRRNSWCKLEYRVSRPVEAPQKELQFSSLTPL